MGIFESDMYLNPKYDYLDKYAKIMWKGFWTPAKYEKLIHEVDSPHYHNAMKPVDKEPVRRCIMAVAMVEDKIKTYWNTLCMDIPQTVVGDVGGVFGNSEVIHRRSYHSLNQEIGINLEEIEKCTVLRDRLKYLNKHLENDPKIIGKKRVLKKLVLFTSLVERASLFTQFYILMSYAKRNVGLKTISALQESTATEEIFHYTFGIELINIIKEEYPQLWDEYLIELVAKNIKEAYKAELKLIDWFFEEGIPNHLTKEEVINFLNFNFNCITKDLGLDIQFKVDDDLYKEKNEWMLLKLYSSHPDFFDNAVGGYSANDEEINIDEFKF